MTRGRRAARGAAAVETALAMIVFLPLFMYTIFLDDLLRYSLDTQEAALSTVWDFTVQDYTQELKTVGAKEPKGGATVVQKQARLMFCDHESGTDRPGEFSSSSDPEEPLTYKDCQDPDHHTALVAHVCWLNSKAKQVTCEPVEKGAGSLGVPLHAEYMGAFTHGGIFKCAARGVVENYLLPETMFAEFSEVDKLTKEKWQGDVHANSNLGTSDNAYFIKEQKLAILTDTWALTTPANILPGNKSGEFHDRVKNVYQNNKNMGYPLMSLYATSFFSSAMSNNLLSPALVGQLVAGQGESSVMDSDNPRNPNIAIVPHAKGMQTPSNDVTVAGQKTRFFNTEWRDWDKDTPKNTYGNRGDFYMGCQQAEKC